jgi:hypothetical protein
VVVTQKDLLQRRRERVFELHWQGLSQREIAAELMDVSQKTVCNDLAWLENNCSERIKSQKKRIALEYEESIATFLYLKKKAMMQLHRAEEQKNEDRMERLYPIIASIEGDIVTLRGVSDIIRREVLMYAEQKAMERDSQLNGAILERS